jgi:S1-C subfamily serine protease
MSETTAPPPSWPPPGTEPAPPHWPPPGAERAGRADDTAPYPPPSAPPWAPPYPPSPPYGGGYGGGQWGPPPVPPPYATPYGPGWGAPGRPGPGRRAAAAALVGAGVLVAALLGGVVGHAVTNTGGQVPAFGGNLPSSPPAGAPPNAAAIAASVEPGLVDINTIITALGIQGAGTGMVLTPSGEVLTNNHVVEGANRISVTDVGNGRTYDATVVGYDRSHDVAVLQLTGASGLATVSMGRSSTVTTGQGVVAIGNANGAGGTPSYAAGTIVATDQTITASDQVDGSSEQLSGLLETDANIVEGDSGGPLVNSAGKVIGMDTAASSGFQFSTTGTQGYAIPIDTALSIARQIEAGQSSATVHVGPTAFLGVGVRNASSISPFGGGSGSSNGAVIVQLVQGGPAARAGLVIGDVITSLAGHTVTSATDLTTIMTTEKPGATVSVGFVDTTGQTQSVEVTLGTGPPQ